MTELGTGGEAAPLDDAGALSADESAILNVILNGRAAWMSGLDLAAATIATDRTILGLAIALDGLLARGWIDAWDHPDDLEHPVFTLSPLGAERLGATLEASGTGEVLRWSVDSLSVRSRSRRPSRSARRRSDDHHRLIEALPDHSPDVEAVAIASEGFERQVKRFKSRTRDELPRPTVLVGMSDPVYLPSQEFARRNVRMGRSGGRYRENLQEGRECLGCHGRKLRPSEYCPRCARWGLDGVFARLRSATEAKAG